MWNQKFNFSQTRSRLYFSSFFCLKTQLLELSPQKNPELHLNSWFIPKWYNLFVVSSWYQYYSQPQEPSKSKRLIFSNYRIFFFNEAKSFGRNLKVTLSSSSQNSLQSSCLMALLLGGKGMGMKNLKLYICPKKPSNRVLSNFPGNMGVFPPNCK